jgi:HPt (histidine-containing phosphotransfer) domain-containing protein
VVNENADLLHNLAHELKGASANIGAKRVTALCEELEVASVGQNFGRAEGILPQLEAELRRARAAVQGYVGAST